MRRVHRRNYVRWQLPWVDFIIRDANWGGLKNDSLEFCEKRSKKHMTYRQGRSWALRRLPFSTRLLQEDSEKNAQAVLSFNENFVIESHLLDEVEIDYIRRISLQDGNIWFRIELKMRAYFLGVNPTQLQQAYLNRCAKLFALTRSPAKSINCAGIAKRPINQWNRRKEYR